LSGSVTTPQRRKYQGERGGGEEQFNRSKSDMHPRGTSSAATEIAVKILRNLNRGDKEVNYGQVGGAAGSKSTFQAGRDSKEEGTLVEKSTVVSMKRK